MQVIVFCGGASYIAFAHDSGASLVRVSYSFVTGFNYAVISFAYVRRLARLNRAYQGFEWVNALSPNPSVGVWWEMELMAIPFVWMVSMHFTFYFAAVSIPKEGEPAIYKSESPVWFVLAGFLFVFGVSHAAYVFLAARRDFEAIEKS